MVGATYILTFDQAAAQQNGTGGATTEQWQVSLGSDTQFSDLMTNPSGDFRPWNEQTMTFTASAPSELLTFLAVGAPSGEPPVALLDGVSLVVATPEPTAIWLTLTMAGMFGIFVIRKGRTSRA